jgi:hypothetical protein
VLGGIEAMAGSQMIWTLRAAEGPFGIETDRLLVAHSQRAMMKAVLTNAITVVLGGLIGANAYSIAELTAVRSELLHLRDQAAHSSEAINSAWQDVSSRLDGLQGKTAAVAQHSPRDVSGDVAWLMAERRVKLVPDLTYIRLGGKNVKAVKPELRQDVDILSALSLRQSLNWTPKGPDDIPVAWPQAYVEPYRQPFNPYTFAINAAIMAYQIKGKVLRPDASNIEALLAALKRYSDTLPSGSLAVRYDFDNPMFDGKIAAGWHSAFGNSAVIIGLLELADATGNEDIRELSGKYVDALRWQGENSDIVMVNGSDFLWFEETPPLNGKPTHIMNGHIATVFSLYRYWQVTHDESVLPLVHAGLATAARYLPELRRPGQVPAYALYDKSVPDYGPLRMIIMTKTLSAISDNPAFGRIMEMLLTDSSLNK